MHDLIGRRGGGGGGGRGGGGRRFFGGGGGGWGGWGWPVAYPAWPYEYGPLYDYGPAYDAGQPYGDSVGASMAALAPGADGLSCQMSLGPDFRLHVSILIDGQRHETSVDVSNLLCQIAQSVARAHVDGRPPEQAARDMAVRTEQAVQSAGAILVGALCDRHHQVVSAGFWDSLKSVYRTASTPVTWFHKKVNQTIRDNPQLQQLVVTAAGAVATAYGGPAAGEAARALAPGIIASSAETGGDPTMLFEQTKKDAHQASGGDPKVAQAFDHAEKAITQTTAAYVLVALANDAAAGDPEAARRVAEIQRSADAGDPVSLRAVKIMAGAQRTSANSADASSAPPP